MNWLATTWEQVWPNLVASLITSTTVVGWHNRHLHKLREEIKKLLELDESE